MTTFPNSPRVLKGGIVLIDPDTAAVQRIIALQYNPDTLTPHAAGAGDGRDSGDRSEALRLKGPPVETIKLDAEIDATDQLEFPDREPDAPCSSDCTRSWRRSRRSSIRRARQLQANNALAQAGTLEIAPMEAPLTLFVWSKQPDRAGAHHRVQRHRGGVRPGAESDPREGQPRHARADRQRSRLRSHAAARCS